MNGLVWFGVLLLAIWLWTWLGLHVVTGGVLVLPFIALLVIVRGLLKRDAPAARRRL